jgi:hypothetical protein
VELLSVELLEEHARRLAALISTAPHGPQRRVHIRQLKAHMRALRQIYTQLAGDTERESGSPAAEWLLDNFPRSSRPRARDIHHDLPPSFSSAAAGRRRRVLPACRASTRWPSS